MIKDIRNLEKVKVDFMFASKRVWKLDLHPKLALESWTCKKISRGEIPICKNNTSSASQNASKKQETKAESEKQKQEMRLKQYTKTKNKRQKWEARNKSKKRETKVRSEKQKWEMKDRNEKW